MTQATAASVSETPKKTRFALVAAVISCGLALIAAFHAPIAFVPAALACGAGAIIAGVLTRDLFGAAGGLLAIFLACGAALRSVILLALIAGLLGRSHQEPARETDQSQATAGASGVAAAVRDIERYDQALAGFRPRVDIIEKHAGAYALVTEVLRKGAQRAFLLKQQNQASFYSVQGQLFAVNNRTEQLHAEMGAARVRFEQKTREINDQSGRISALCTQPALVQTESCRQAREGYSGFLTQVAAVKAAIDHDNAAYEIERRQQQSIMDTLS